MGKKRRLNRAKAKFAAKHANHPRARLLAQQGQPLEEEATIATAAPAPPSTESIKSTTETTLTEKIEDVVPKTSPQLAKKPKPTTVRKKTSPPGKKTTNTAKKTNTAARKTPKRVTKKKTTSSPA